MLKYVLDGLNSVPTSKPELSSRFSVQVGSAGLFTNGSDFGEDSIDPGSLTPEQTNNRAVAESIATYSNKTAYLRLVSDLTDAANTGVCVLSLTFTGSFLKLLNLSPSKPYSLVGGNTQNLIPINLGLMNHDYIYVRCSQSKNEWSCLQEGSQLNMSDLLAVVPCNYGKFIYYEKYNTGGKNVLACSSMDTIDLVFTDKWGNVLYGMTDFLAEITIDFVRLGVKEYKISLSDIKNVL